MNPNEDNRAKPIFNYARLQQLMEEQDIDAIVGHSPRHFYYLSGFESMEYDIEARTLNFVVITADTLENASVVIPSWESITLQSSPCWVPNKVFAGQFYIKDGPALDGPVEQDKWAALKRIIRERNLSQKRVAFELDQLPLAAYRRLQTMFNDMEIVDASPILHRARMVKTAVEIDQIRAVTALTEWAIEDACSAMTVGMTEQELANQIASRIVLNNARVTYMQLTNGGSAGLLRPTGRLLEREDVIKADIGATIKGYNSDVGRTYAIRAATDEQRAIYEVAYSALQSAIGAIEPGRPVSDVFKAAMAAWHRAGYTHVRRHHVGHGIGLEAHEAPWLAAENETPVEVGMVLAVEVPYYVYGLGGFAPEDIVVVTEAGLERLSDAPQLLPVLG